MVADMVKRRDVEVVASTSLNIATYKEAAMSDSDSNCAGRSTPILDTRRIKRFQSRFAVVASGCWEWRGYTNACGYGTFCLGHNKSYLAHRVSYEHYRGPIGKLQVLHRCDNPKCVNPDHLFLGTQQDNIRDMQEKGRAVFPSRRVGEDHPAAILNRDQVADIRSRYKPRIVTMPMLAREYGVSKSAINMILKRRRWSDVKFVAAGDEQPHTRIVISD